MYLGVVLFSLLCTVYGQVSRTNWVYIRGPPSFTPDPVVNNQEHGNPGEYTVSSIPPVTANWNPCGSPDPFCTDGQNIGVQSVSRLPGCWSLLDFTYFQTFVTVGADTVVNQFSIDFTLMDDGSMITIFNNEYPSGLVVAGSYVYLGLQATINLAAYVITGVNRVVITQVDDCAVGNNIIGVVTLNGQEIIAQCDNPPDQCSNTVPINNVCTVVNLADGTVCNDGNLCTQNDTCQDGSCYGADPVVCAVGWPGQCKKCGSTINGGVCNPLTGQCSSQKRNLHILKR